jgi:hypothetical protein
MRVRGESAQASVRVGQHKARVQASSTFQEGLTGDRKTARRVSRQELRH